MVLSKEHSSMSTKDHRHIYTQNFGWAVVHACAIIHTNCSCQIPSVLQSFTMYESSNLKLDSNSLNLLKTYVIHKFAMLNARLCDTLFPYQ